MTAKHRADPLLPSGTVTFLFTDIEGSTKLWETQRAAMQIALARHDALLRQIIQRHHGHVVKSSGDGVCAVFASATDALEAAIAAQQALGDEPWPQSLRIRSRMAVHSGPAELRDGDYFGPTLNRVARLLALGHGGQTLVSAITHDLCREYLPPDVSLKSLGEHSLKDLDRREAVFEVRRTKAPLAFPPLKSLLSPIDADTPSIAVLPFVNMSPDEENEYFADGLSEELLNVLAKIRGLRVASRTSAFYFKGKDVDLPTVAQKLNVATILEGSVRKAGKRVRITAQLIEVETDSHLWSETYDRELDDIFAVQDDIAQSVVKELRTALFGAQADQTAGAQVAADVATAALGRGENAEAYQLYLQGRHFMERMTPIDSARGMDLFERALALQPDFALAWAGLARAWAQKAEIGGAPVAESYRRAREAAQRAIDLEPTLVEGHVEMGCVRTDDWDWQGAEASLARAMQLAPGNATLLGIASILARIRGRHDAAIALSRRAVALDPLSVAAHLGLSRSYVDAGLLQEAEAAISKAMDLGPSTGFVHATLGRIRLLQNRAAEALAAFRVEALDYLQMYGVALAQHALAHPQESDAALAALIARYSDTCAYQIAEVYAFRDEIDLAFDSLARAYDLRDHGLSHLKGSFCERHLQGDPRWQPFLEKMGLAD